MSEHVYHAYAKINLYLDVLQRRRDGFHNIETIFQTVDLADRLTFSVADDAVSLTCSDPALDCGPDNLVMRAALILQEAAGDRRGARIHLDKHIPVAAGMAGGSVDAAATLVALNTLWELELPPARLHRVALQLGSDVPYCLEGGTAVATRRGEALAPLPAFPETWLVLLHPALAVSTAAVYGSEALQRSTVRPFAGRTASLRRAIRAYQCGDMADLVHNTMEDAVFEQHPELADWKRRLLTAGCEVAAMSGSGPTVFGLCTSRDQARTIADTCAGIRSSVVRTVPRSIERVQ